MQQAREDIFFQIGLPDIPHFWKSMICNLAEWPIFHIMSFFEICPVFYFHLLTALWSKKIINSSVDLVCRVGCETGRTLGTLVIPDGNILTLGLFLAIGSCPLKCISFSQSKEHYSDLNTDKKPHRWTEFALSSMKQATNVRWEFSC